MLRCDSWLSIGINQPANKRNNLPMKLIKLSFCAVGAIALVGCSSSGGSSDNSGSSAQAALQGTWSSICFEDDGDSIRNDFVVSGNTFTQTEVNFLNTTSCDGTLALNFNEHGTFVIPAEVTELPDGNANHVDATYTRGSITASQGFLDLLEAGGTTLADELSAAGITGDPNNLTLEEISRLQAEFYSIYRINSLDGGGSAIQFGDDSGSFDGSSPALRPTELSPVAIFTKAQ